MKKPSRGLRADGETTRTRILEVAGELFAATGFAETTNKAVAARAEVDLASINYHFGSRDGLYQAVLVEAHHRVVNFENLQRLAQSALPATEKLRLVIDQLVQKATDSTGDWALSVLARELLVPSSHVEVLFQSEISKKVTLVVAILAEITHLPENDPALLRCLLSVVAPSLLLLIGRRGIPGPVQGVLNMPREQIVDHLHRFAVAGLEAVGQSTQKISD